MGDDMKQQRSGAVQQDRADAVEQGVAGGHPLRSALDAAGAAAVSRMASEEAHALARAAVTQWRAYHGDPKDFWTQASTNSILCTIMFNLTAVGKSLVKHELREAGAPAEVIDTVDSESFVAGVEG